MTEQQFNQWLSSYEKKQVWTLKLTGKRFNNTEKTLYFSSADFLHPDYTFFGCLVSPLIKQSMSKSILANYSEIEFGDIKLIDHFGEFAEHRLLNDIQAELKLGDVIWDYDNHRVMIEGKVTDWSFDSVNHSLRILNKKSKTDKLISYNEINLKEGGVANVLHSLLLNLGLTSSEIDANSISTFNSKFPIDVKIPSFSGERNGISICDEIMGGFPADYGVNIFGKIQVNIFPAVTTLYFPYQNNKIVSLLKPIQYGSTIDRVYKVIVKSPNLSSNFEKEKTIFNKIGREEKINSIVKTSSDADKLADHRLNIFSKKNVTMRLTIDPILLNLGDTILIEKIPNVTNSRISSIVTDITIKEDYMEIETCD